MTEPIITQILRLIKDEGPLSPKKIAEKLPGKKGTVYPLVSILRQLGLVAYYTAESGGMTFEGVYVITDYGEQCPALRK